MNLSKCW